MRLREFTNAEEQLGLLKQILDCSWRAIADQAAAQKKEQELKRAQAASKPRVKRPATPVSAKPVPAKPAASASAQNVQTTAQNKANTATSNALLPNATDGTPYKTAHVPIRPYSGYSARKDYGVQN